LISRSQRNKGPGEEKGIARRDGGKGRCRCIHSPTKGKFEDQKKRKLIGAEWLRPIGRERKARECLLLFDQGAGIEAGKGILREKAAE